MALPVASPMTVADLDAVMALERRCFTDPWTRRMYLTDLTENRLATYLVLRLPTEAQPLPVAGPAQDPAATLLAYGGFWLMVDEAHIATIATHPAWRGRGLGLWLMLALLESAMARGAHTSTLEVRVSNLPAQNLYRKLGYAVVGRRYGYYRNGEDGLIMSTPPLNGPFMQERLALARAEAVARLVRVFTDCAGSEFKHD